MASAPIDSYKLLTTLKATGKDSNYSAEELANAFQVAQQGADLVTVPIFEARMREGDARFEAVETKFDAKLDFVRTDIKGEVKSSQLQNLLWLSGIVLASNGAVIAL